MYQEIADELAVLGFKQTRDQCKEQIKLLKSDYQKAGDENCTSRKSLSSCLFYKDFDQGLGTVPSTESPAVHNSLVSWDGNLLTPESSIESEESQQLDQPSEVTLMLILLPREALPPEQLQYVLGPYSEELFDDPWRSSPLWNWQQKQKRQK